MGPIRPTVSRMTQSHHVARSELSTSARASSPPMFLNFSHFFGAISTATPPPLWLTAGGTSATLLPLDHHHHVHLVAAYRLRPTTSAGAASMATDEAVFFVVSHCRHCLSSYFLAPASSLLPVRWPRSLPLAEAEFLRPSL